jgi:hypothetical protein
MLTIITGDGNSGRTTLLAEKASAAGAEVVQVELDRQARQKRFEDALSLENTQTFIDDFDLFGISVGQAFALQDRIKLNTTIVIRRNPSLEMLVNLAGIEIKEVLHCRIKDGELQHIPTTGQLIQEGIRYGNIYAEC